MQQQQFYRTSILLGDATNSDLMKKHVLIAGVGGVGGQVVEAIARAGIGRITIIDNDVVDITNINRQLIATLPDVGKSKVELFLHRIESINPLCKVVAHERFLAEDNLAELIPPDVDFVLDCIDTVPSKLALISYCVRNKINIGLKDRGITKGVVVAFSEEPRINAPLLQEKGLRPINGTISYLPPLFGLMLAGHVLKKLIDKIRLQDI